MVSMMELLNHLGIYPFPSHLTYIEQLRGLSRLIVLLTYLLFYNQVYIVILVTRIWFPSTAEYIKRETVSSFWNLSLYFLDLNGVEIQLVGDRLEPDSALVISNHRSIVDFFVMQHLALHSDSQTVISEKDNNFQNLILPKVNFFTWFSIWTIPTVRVLLHMLGCDENWELDEKLNSNAFKKIIVSKVPEWVVVFPEVNIFTLRSSIVQSEMTSKFYLPKLHNLLYPRYSAFHNTIELLDETSFSRLYDITILYYKNPETQGDSTDNIKSSTPPPTHRWERKHKTQLSNIQSALASSLLSESSALIEKAANHSTVLKPSGEFKAPTLFEILAQRPTNYIIRVHVKSKLLSRVPVRRRKLEKWLESHWCDKDALIDKLQRDMFT